MVFDIKSILENCNIVDKISFWGNNVFKQITYDIIFQCRLIVDEDNKMSIIVCIPKKWKQNLIDIYIKDLKKIAFLPHVDYKGKLCLFETEGVLIDQNLPGILTQSLFRAKKILEEGISGKNHEDFIKEFELYWAQLPSCRRAYFVTPTIENSQNVKCILKIVSQRKNEKESEYLKRMNSSPIYIGKDPESLKRWNIESTGILNAAYFVVSSQNNIFPPDIRKPVSIDYLNNLLKLIPEEIVFELLSRLSQKKVIVFAIKQPIGITNYMGFFIKGGRLEQDQEKYSLKNIEYLQPLEVKRSDKKYLMKRTLEKEWNIGKKRILVAGCGSIGGHLIYQLAKAGYEDITIVDDDILTEENVFRHILGMEYVSSYKCVALEKYIRKNIPEVSIKSLVEKFEDAVIEGDLELNNYDLIISAIGNHNINRWINSFIMGHKINTPVIYAWNEVYGIGNHIAYFNYNNEACYECLFGRNEENGELYDKSAYCAPGQKIAQNIGGCGKNYIPYGDVISIKTVLICLDVVDAVFEHKIEENLLVSLKGDSHYFKKNGLKLSNRYYGQTENIKKLMGSQFVNKKCGVCNGSDRKE
ncbi:MAG: ThiF family adenylyltransferase [[Clostridium] spiroforme]|uniref:ThiF family adenylyltransferase n=1 Tax=Thomasclavelia spiroformis TaxID=29348 RepID=UPI001D3745B7|nr:ThiF family adenylyltransferase [Thomasclavelia spiroformis]MBS7217724.1 ThiF family adenylyltransferase [Thomasclavelia spiroformis]